MKPKQNKRSPSKRKIILTSKFEDFQKSKQIRDIKRKHEENLETKVLKKFKSDQKTDLEIEPEKNQSPKSDSNSSNHETDFSSNYKNNVKYFENKEKKPFQCDICKKIFSHKGSLNMYHQFIQMWYM